MTIKKNNSVFFNYLVLKQRLRQIQFFYWKQPSLGNWSLDLNLVKQKLSFYSPSKGHELEDFSSYFQLIEFLGLREDWSLKTSVDDILISGSLLFSPRLNSNNRKFVVFCHGVTNDRWTMFFPILLFLKWGYTVVCYDARNHGSSQPSYNTLGKVESSDLQDVINFITNKYSPEKIGLYGFSMGAATCIFWIGFYGSKQKNVTFAICDSPFDRFSVQWSHVLKEIGGSEKSLKTKFLSLIINKFLKNSTENLLNIEPIEALSDKLPLKLLLLHGLEDEVINWSASYNIWQKIIKNPSNRKKVSFYLCKHAKHGEVWFFSEYLPGALCWGNSRRVSRFKFSSLIHSFLKKNF